MRYFLLLLLWGLAASAKSITDILESDDRFELLVGHLKRTDLFKEVQRLSGSTLVAPTNEALNRTDIYVTRAQLLYHILPLEVHTKSLHDGQLLETIYKNDARPQLVKVTSNKGKVGLNGAEIVDADISADNGVMLQAIDGLLEPPTDLDKTLFHDQDLKQFGHLARVSDVGTELHRANGYTVFATHDVLDGLDPLERAYLNHTESKADLAKILRHQIYDQVVYVEGLPKGKHLYKSLQGEHLEVINKDGKLTVNGVNVIRSDILASNGVIHLLEKAILPKDREFLRLTPRKALLAVNATKFLHLLDENDLGVYIDDSNLKPHTLLAPTDENFDDDIIPRSELKAWLKLHILHDKYTPGGLVNEALLSSEATEHLGARQRVQVHVGDDADAATIRFNKVGLIDKPVELLRCVVYPLVQPLTLPRDPLSTLPTHLDLSTFVASLYASGAADSIQDGRGITLFAPTNKAFSRLGLAAKYLLQPEAKDRLSEVLQFHAVRNLMYFNSTAEGDTRQPTLSGPEINVQKTEDSMYVRGSGAGDQHDRTVIAKVVEHDLIVSNGVVHVIDRVQLPVTLGLTLEQLLRSESTNSFIRLLQKTGIAEKVFEDHRGEPYTLLAPTDTAFARLDFAKLLTQPEKLLKIAKLHVLPAAFPRMVLPVLDDDDSHSAPSDEKDSRKTHKAITSGGTEFPSLLSKDDPVIIKKSDDGYTVQVKGAGKTIQVKDLGRASHGGGVILIDEVLLPRQEESKRSGLPWWAVILIVLGVLLGTALLGLAGLLGYRWWKQRHEGSISLAD